MNFLNTTFYFFTSRYHLKTTIIYPRTYLQSRWMLINTSYILLAIPVISENSILFSLALRIRRICSTTERFQQRTNEQLELLCRRGHKRQYVQSQINKALQTLRRDTLYYKSKTLNTDRPVFVTTYIPSL